MWWKATQIVEGGDGCDRLLERATSTLNADTGKHALEYRRKDKIIGAANSAPAPGGKGDLIVWAGRLGP